MSVKSFLTKYFGQGQGQAQGQEQKTSVSEDVNPFITIRSVVKPPLPVPTKVSSDTQDKTYHIFTDGACQDNGKRTARGGFGVYFYSEPAGLLLDVSQPLARNENQTNNRAELRAIQTAVNILLQRLPTLREKYTSFCIWSDSEYSIHCVTKWAVSWKRNGWKKKDGKTIQNLDLIQDVYDKLKSNPSITLQYVKAHNDSRASEFPWCGNVKADALATSAINSSA